MFATLSIYTSFQNIYSNTIYWNAELISYPFEVGNIVTPKDIGASVVSCHVG